MKATVSVTSNDSETHMMGSELDRLRKRRPMQLLLHDVNYGKSSLNVIECKVPNRELGRVQLLAVSPEEARKSVAMEPEASNRPGSLTDVPLPKRGHVVQTKHATTA